MAKSRQLGAMLSCVLILSSITFVFAATSSKAQAAIVYGLTSGDGYTVYDPAGIVTGASGLNFSSYGGIAVDSQGRVYGVNTGGGYTMYDPATNTTYGNNTVGFWYKGGIAVDNQGRVYGINQAGGYTVYDPATDTALANNTVNFFSEGGIAVSAVPIPTALWLFGSGLLGLVGVARKKAVNISKY